MLAVILLLFAVVVSGIPSPGPSSVSPKGFNALVHLKDSCTGFQESLFELCRLQWVEILPATALLNDRIMQKEQQFGFSFDKIDYYILLDRDWPSMGQNIQLLLDSPIYTSKQQRLLFDTTLPRKARLENVQTWLVQTVSPYSNLTVEWRNIQFNNSALNSSSDPWFQLDAAQGIAFTQCDFLSVPQKRWFDPTAVQPVGFFWSDCRFEQSTLPFLNAYRRSHLRVSFQSNNITQAGSSLALYALHPALPDSLSYNFRHAKNMKEVEFILIANNRWVDNLPTFSEEDRIFDNGLELTPLLYIDPLRCHGLFRLENNYINGSNLTAVLLNGVGAEVRGNQFWNLTVAPLALYGYGHLASLNIFDQGQPEAILLSTKAISLPYLSLPTATLDQNIYAAAKDVLPAFLRDGTFLCQPPVVSTLIAPMYYLVLFLGAFVLGLLSFKAYWLFVHHNSIKKTPS